MTNANMKELQDIAGVTAVAINGAAAALAWGVKWSTVTFASAASEFVAKEVLPWVTLSAVIITTTLAVMNRLDKQKIGRRLTEQDPCHPTWWSSRTCAKGTNGCNEQHSNV